MHLMGFVRKIQSKIQALFKMHFKLFKFPVMTVKKKYKLKFLNTQDYEDLASNLIIIILDSSGDVLVL